MLNEVFAKNELVYKVRYIWKTFVAPNDKKKLFFFSFCQLILSFLDILSIGLIGLIGNLTITGLQNTNPNTFTGKILTVIGLDKMNFSKQITSLAVISCVLLILKTIISLRITKSMLNILGKVSARFSSLTLNKLLNLDLQFINQKTAQSYIYDLTEGARAASMGIIGQFFTVFADLCMFTVVIISFSIYDFSLSVIVISYLLIIIVGLHLILNKTASKAGASNAVFSLKSNELISDSIKLFRDLYLRNSQTNYVDKFHETRNKFSKSIADLVLLPYLAKYALEISILIGTLLFFSWQLNSYNPADAFLNLSLVLAAGFRLAPSLLRVQQSLLAAGTSSSITKSLFDLVRQIEAQNINNSNDSGSAVTAKTDIELKSVNFNYTNSQFKMQNINISIPERSFLAIVGETGSGKTTLVELILGLKNTTGGKISIAGQLPKKFISTNAGKIAFVPQEVELINDSIEKNIIVGLNPADYTDEKILNVLSKVQLIDFVKNLEMGIKTNIGPNGVKLSGGQKQRLGIARALITDPQILILDEATSSLDAETEFQISRNLQMLGKNKTLIVIAHRLSTIKNADNIIYLEKGNVLAEGNFETLRAKVPNFDKQVTLLGLN